MSPLIEYFIYQLGWQGAMLVIAGLMLKCCIFGALFRPLPNIFDSPERLKTKNVETFKKEEDVSDIKLTVTEEEEEEDDDDGKEFIENFLRQPRLSLSHENEFPNSLAPPPDKNLAKSLCSVEVCVNDQPMNNLETKPRSHSFTPGFLYRKDIFYSGSLVNIPNYKPTTEKMPSEKKKKSDCFLFRWLNCSDEIIDNFAEMIDLSLMKNYVFLIFSISNFLTSVGYHIPFIYLKVN